MKKFLTTLLIMLAGLAANSAPSDIDSAISDSEIHKDAISVSVKDVTSGKTLYELHARKPMPPASTQKVVTATVATDTLGNDYEFTTSLYKTTNNELQLKLSGDPNLSKGDLSTLMKAAKAKNITTPKAFFIDDFVMDSVEWGEGWQWDDDLNPLMQKFSSYNLDKNLLTITIDPSKNEGAPGEIKLNTFYPVTFMNLTLTGNKNNIEISRNNHISPDVITISGVINSRVSYKIPVNSPKRYFTIKLEEAISSAKIEYYDSFVQRKTPLNNIYLVDEIKHPIEPVLIDIYQNSSNISAETLFKTAGGKFVNNTGALKNALLMFYDYCKKYGLKPDDIKIVDGSGVSKNNLMTADFMTEFLIFQTKRDDFEKYMNIFPTAGEGTLKNRMLYFKDIIYAKTGTLTDISAICGYIKTRNGNLIAFDIMINDPKSSSSAKKTTEEQIIRAIYSKY